MLSRPLLQRALLMKRVMIETDSAHYFNYGVAVTGNRSGVDTVKLPTIVCEYEKDAIDIANWMNKRAAAPEQDRTQ